MFELRVCWVAWEFGFCGWWSLILAHRDQGIYSHEVDNLVSNSALQIPYPLEMDEVRQVIFF